MTETPSGGAQCTPRSVSQYNQYHRCPYSWYLSRVLKAWDRPAAWLPQGSAVHKAAEEFEKSGRTMSLEEMKAVFAESYAVEVAQYTEITPRFDFWTWSGPYAGKVDLERRYGIGMEQTERYYRYYTETAPDEVIWIAPDGTPGIELGFVIELGDVPVRGFIDAIITMPDGSVRVRDNKTGKQPGDDFQLGVYSVAVSEQYGVDRPLTGDYWMGGPGKPTHPYDLSEWTTERLTVEFAELEAMIQQDDFPAICVCGREWDYWNDECTSATPEGCSRG